MTDFFYPVNETSDSWGYGKGVLEVFRSVKDGEEHDWHLSTGYRMLHAGDLIWVYASQPVSQLVALGVAADDPYLWLSDGVAPDEWRVAIRWDHKVSTFLVDHRSPSDLLDSRIQTVRRASDGELARLISWLHGEGEAIPDPAIQAERFAQVRQRQGQQEFRAALIAAYEGRCAITGCDVDATLQAAHIEPYTGRNSNVTNGLLLRADLHNLFDKGLIWIDSGRVRVSPHLRSAYYEDLDGHELRQPTRRRDRPDNGKLRAHRETARR